MLARVAVVTWQIFELLFPCFSDRCGIIFTKPRGMPCGCVTAREKGSVHHELLFCWPFKPVSVSELMPDFLAPLEFSGRAQQCFKQPSEQETAAEKQCKIGAICCAAALPTAICPGGWQNLSFSPGSSSAHVPCVTQESHLCESLCFGHSGL